MGTHFVVMSLYAPENLLLLVLFFSILATYHMLYVSKGVLSGKNRIAFLYEGEIFSPL